MPVLYYLVEIIKCAQTIGGPSTKRGVTYFHKGSKFKENY